MFRMFSEVGVHAMSCMHLFLQLETVLALTLVIYHECISQRPRDFTSCFCCCSCHPACAAMAELCHRLTEVVRLLSAVADGPGDAC